MQGIRVFFIQFGYWLVCFFNRLLKLKNQPLKKIAIYVNKR